MSDELARFRREFAAMNALLSEVPDHPTDPEDIAKLGQVRRFMYDERASITTALILPLADLYYLEGYTQQEIGELISVTNQAVSTNLLGPHGPREYVVVRRVGDEYELGRVAVSPDRAGTSHGGLLQMREEGWRVAPAAWRVDAGTVDPAELWDRLDKMETDS